MMPGKWKNSSIHFTIFYPALFIFPKAPNCQNSKKCYFIIITIIITITTTEAWGSAVGSIPGGVTGDFFRGTPDRTMSSEVDSASESEYRGYLLG